MKKKSIGLWPNSAKREDGTTDPFSRPVCANKPEKKIFPTERLLVDLKKASHPVRMWGFLCYGLGRWAPFSNKKGQARGGVILKLRGLK